MNLVIHSSIEILVLGRVEINRSSVGPSENIEAPSNFPSVGIIEIWSKLKTKESPET